MVLLIYGYLWEKNVDLRINKIINSVRTHLVDFQAVENNSETKSFEVFEELKADVQNASLACSFGLGRLGNQVLNEFQLLMSTLLERLMLRVQAKAKPRSALRT
jgi:hypothetical protein